MLQVEEMTIAQAHDGFRNSTFTCRELVESFLHRIQTLDKSGPKIHATWAISTVASHEAEALDLYYKQTGKFKGRLHGIPVLVKDQADTKGIVTTYGTIAAINNVPDEDAFIVKKLKDEGAVILGKTSMGDWATTWFSASSVTDWAFTQNPYKRDHDVGASSSGSAAAIAANFAILSVAEDTGGSIRCPASFNNLVGIRCTPGLVSRSGFCPLIKTQDCPGPLARTVTDCARMLDCLVGFDPQDEWTAAVLTAGPPRGGSYAANLDPTAISRAKIGVIRSLFGSDADPACHAVNLVISKALAKLEATGTTFVDVELADLKHYMTFTPTYLCRSRADINSFLATKPHLPQDVATIVPREPPHPSLDFTALVAHGPKDPMDDPTYLQRLLDRDTFQRRITCLMAEHNLDALAFPDVQIPAPRHEDATTSRFPTCWDFPTNTLLASQARIPAISVPAGFTDDGLPVGLELVSWEYREQALLNLARGVEVRIAARRAPNLWSV
ncbi:putative amidase family protein [Coleophoma crateriformis]|uniref:Putative amidase family protein n=1 Tax=Coleophoma crateriformis TaxID=565419 RepID=A0A3D8Q484_9HELO|nr:putative amidase family protein [Coleophoma crateriformis]